MYNLWKQVKRNDIEYKWHIILNHFVSNTNPVDCDRTQRHLQWNRFLCIDFKNLLKLRNIIKFEFNKMFVQEH